MPFIGQEPITGAFHKLDDITTSSINTYDLLLNGGAYSPASANHLMVSLNGVIQSPGSSFTVSGSQITFVPSSGTLSSSDSIDFIMAYGDVLNIGTPSDGTVTSEKIAVGAVTDAKITGMAASKLTGALPAISGAALTGIDNPVDDHIRVTFSGPTVSNNSVTFLTPTLQGQTNGGFTLQNTNEIKISVTGHYLVTFIASGATASGAAGYTPISYIYKNTSNWNQRAGIRYYAGSSTVDFPSNTTIVAMDSTSDYFKFGVYQNTGGNVTSPYGTATIVRLGD